MTHSEVVLLLLPPWLGPLWQQPLQQAFPPCPLQISQQLSLVIRNLMPLLHLLVAAVGHTQLQLRQNSAECYWQGQQPPVAQLSPLLHQMCWTHALLPPAAAAAMHCCSLLTLAVNSLSSAVPQAWLLALLTWRLPALL